MSPTSYQAALPRVIPSLLSATLIIIPYSNGFVKRVRKVFLQQKQRTKTRLLTFFPENQQPRQFTPLREGRRDAQAVRRLRTQFQFTPLREGRLDARPPDYVPELISIHAPPRGATSMRPSSATSRSFQFTPLREGRHQCARLPTRRAHFNSRPSARGDERGHPPAEEAQYFNSRPSARGDRRIATATRPPRLFQFTPLREGRHNQHFFAVLHRFISIHAPPRGATPHLFALARERAFQFTPLREGRPL